MSDLRELVLDANRALVDRGLVTGTFGNVSAVDRAAGVFVIKPSGVPYDELTPDHMVVVSLETGLPVGTTLRPSSDTPTHLALYRAFDCGGIAHTHSEFATTLAQAGLPIRCTGTTHADYFRGDVPVTREMTRAEVGGDYEANTGLVIAEAFTTAGLDPAEVPGVLVLNHGPFAWGAGAMKAVEHAAILEYLARLEVRLRLIAPDGPRPARHLIDRHYDRKHGGGAYYGQP